MDIDSESTKYTAFNTCYGSFKFLRMPMGLSSSPSSFQLLMDSFIADIRSGGGFIPFLEM
jgi:hypothetical protein